MPPDVDCGNAMVQPLGNYLAGPPKVNHKLQDGQFTQVPKRNKRYSSCTKALIRMSMALDITSPE